MPRKEDSLTFGTPVWRALPLDYDRSGSILLSFRSWRTSFEAEDVLPLRGRPSSTVPPTLSYLLRPHLAFPPSLLPGESPVDRFVERGRVAQSAKFNKIGEAFGENPRTMGRYVNGELGIIGHNQIATIAQRRCHEVPGIIAKLFRDLLRSNASRKRPNHTS
ncbi:hypothetical protein QLX08_010899 [Tetragonisca angustula]|uniref:Uncharacterized protein n=1 Tax=Tetragonisca angustula TaxID=166442 RepID=A0AAW0ZD68_9HYME